MATLLLTEAGGRSRKRRKRNVIPHNNQIWTLRGQGVTETQKKDFRNEQIDTQDY